MASTSPRRVLMPARAALTSVTPLVRSMPASGTPPTSTLPILPVTGATDALDRVDGLGGDADLDPLELQQREVVERREALGQQLVDEILQLVDGQVERQRHVLDERRRVGRQRDGHAGEAADGAEQRVVV